MVGPFIIVLFGSWMVQASFFGLNFIFKLKSTFLDLSEKVSALLMTNPLHESTPLELNSDLTWEVLFHAGSLNAFGLFPREVKN